MSTNNKMLNEVAHIDELLSEAVGTLSMDVEEDRARMAWWIHQTFCVDGCRDKLQQAIRKPKGKTVTVRSIEPIEGPRRKLNLSKV